MFLLMIYALNRYYIRTKKSADKTPLFASEVFDYLAPNNE